MDFLETAQVSLDNFSSEYSSTLKDCYIIFLGFSFFWVHCFFCSSSPTFLSCVSFHQSLHGLVLECLVQYNRLVFPLVELRDILVPSSSPILDMPCNIIKRTSSRKLKSPKWIGQKWQYRVGKLLQREGKIPNMRVSLFQPINFPYVLSDS